MPVSIVCFHPFVFRVVKVARDRRRNILASREVPTARSKNGEDAQCCRLPDVVPFSPFLTEFGETESSSSSGLRGPVPGCRAWRSPCRTSLCPAPVAETLFFVT